jgi:lysophospholipase L1-like esterase
MINDNVELHNIDEVVEVGGAVRLQRAPEALRLKLNEFAQEKVLSPANAEIRFVCQGPSVRLTLSSEGQTDATVFYGPFQGKQPLVIGAEPQVFEFPAQPDRLARIPEDFGNTLAFSPKVCRIMLQGAPLQIHAIEGDVRPPVAGEVPALRYLAYGTSITHGNAATGPHLTYVAQVARRLNADLINLGLGGAAHCEFEISDYIAARKDWHVATLELSVNMVGAGFSLDEFYERVSYMVNKVAGSDTSRPVACITIYPHFRDLGDSFSTPNQVASPEEYRQKLRDAVAACPYPNVHLIEGPDILQQFSDLTSDLLHPADNGMIQMGENLARKLAPLVSPHSS